MSSGTLGDPGAQLANSDIDPRFGEHARRSLGHRTTVLLGENPDVAEGCVLRRGQRRRQHLAFSHCAVSAETAPREGPTALFGGRSPTDDVLG